MFYANVHIDLPSEELLRRCTALEWLAGLVGRAPDLRSGEELSTVTGLSVFKASVDALEQLGITDVLSVIVDHRAVYVDTDENSGDLGTAVAELDARRVLEAPFETMDMALSHRAEGLHTLISLQLRRRVPAGSPELEVAFAARLDAMQVRRGDSPADYAERLRSIARDTARLAAASERFASSTQAALEALVAQLGELVVSSSTSAPSLRLIRPGPRAVDHFRRLTWGASVRMPKYRPVPVRNRLGAYNEPFYQHYFDPYFDFAAWVTLTAIVAGQGWRSLPFTVVDADGQPAFGAEGALGQAAIAGTYPGLEPGVAPVRIVEEALVVDPSVPELGGADPGELGDPRVVLGYGGDGRVEEGSAGAAWEGASNGSSGAELGGSCGSSCGGCGG